MSVSIKCSDIISQFDGDGDFSEWVRKLEMVAKLQNITSLEAFLPLFLSRGAFAVYESLTESVKKDYKKLTKALREAFSINQFRAYEEFVTRRLLPGEAVDVYVSDLKRLASLVDSKINETWVKCAMVSGLPTEIQRQLKAACSLEKMTLAEVIERARMLINVVEVEMSVVAKLGNKRASREDRQKLIKCFICEKDGHFARYCPMKRRTEQTKEIICYSCGEPGHIAPTCIAKREHLVSINQKVVMMNGEEVICNASCCIRVIIQDIALTLDCLVAEVLPSYQMLLGMDAVAAMGGVTIDSSGKVSFGKKSKIQNIAAATKITDVHIQDDDFSALFSNGKWIVEWKWKAGDVEPILENSVAQYKISKESQTAFDDEVEEWIKSGWLRPYHGKYDGVIPLLAVVESNKNKVRPVMDYRELNEYVSSHTGTSDICGEKLRKWRRMGTKIKMVDLRKAYLQLHVANNLWKYQVVKFKGKTYCLTRLGFGLNVAPKIMTAIVNKVLSMDEEVRAGTDSYIDDIIVNEEIVSCERVLKLLNTYGLQTKPVEPIVGARVLGLRVFKENQEIFWRRDNVVQKVTDEMTKREIFSLCGQLVGHFPVAKWLRPACSFIKRSLTEHRWDEKACQKATTMISEIMEEVAVRDPVKGKWAVPTGKKGMIWCDASSLAIGVCIEIDGEIVEDVSWLRKPNDSQHINLAELNSVIKGINLALKWDLTDIIVKTDSATVFSWVTSMLTKDRRIKTHGLGEALVHRRLTLLSELMYECNLSIKVELVRSEQNKADKLTRVPKRWLTATEQIGASACASSVTEKFDKIRKVHQWNHFRVNRTLYVVRRCYAPEKFTREDIEKVVKSCKECLSIDPSPIHWETGELEVNTPWSRLACDVTHFEGKKYLSIVDCGPSRFAIWRLIKNESCEQVTKVLSEVFMERGPPVELLMDNGRTFHSYQLKQLCDKWSIKIIFRCGNRPSGNGIVERNHRTIKRMAARTRGSIPEMVFWYNFTPKESLNEETTPSAGVYTYTWRCPGEVIKNNQERNGDSFKIGETVFVKPQGARCTTRWRTGIVTGNETPVSVDINGIPHHVADIRQDAK